MLTEKQRSLLVLNGIGLLATSVVIGWFFMFHVLEAIELFPIIPRIEIDIPGDRRAWNMAHMEAITHGVILIAFGMAAPYLKLGDKERAWFVYSALIMAWLFTLPAWANALFETRGLAFDGGPFKGGLANNIIYLTGWPPVLAVHVVMYLGVKGAWAHYRGVKA